jgi:hypothetical protein
MACSSFERERAISRAAAQLDKVFVEGKWPVMHHALDHGLLVVSLGALTRIRT